MTTTPGESSLAALSRQEVRDLKISSCLCALATVPRALRVVPFRSREAGWTRAEAHLDPETHDPAACKSQSACRTDPAQVTEWVTYQERLGRDGAAECCLVRLNTRRHLLGDRGDGLVDLFGRRSVAFELGLYLYRKSITEECTSQKGDENSERLIDDAGGTNLIGDNSSSKSNRDE
jgi:hypothetical protein